MAEILKKVKLSNEVIRMTLRCPEIARERKAGQFVVVQKGGDFNERIPLTIADADPVNGTIDIVFQTVGEGTHILGRMEEGDEIENVLGPLGRPTDIKKYGKVVCVAGGVGVAPLYPIAKAMKEAGNDVRVIIGARNASLVLEIEEMREIDPNLIIITDDGSLGRKGVVTLPLKEICEEWHPDCCVAIGPTVMMKFCALTTKEYGIHTIVSLNTIMIDGTGMCGGCRLMVGGETKFACCDGPEFDGHLVDWDNLMLRSRSYRDTEAEAHHRCHMEMQIEEGEC